jgi:hypothetical protein
MNLTGYIFTLPGATLTVTNENVITGVFHANFDDASSGIDVGVTGKLTPLGSHWDTMMFQGIGTMGLATEKVAFNGNLHEAVFPFMFGKLTASYSLPIAQWTVTKPAESHGRPPLPPFPFLASQAALNDALLVDSVSHPVSVNPQPLPPHGVLSTQALRLDLAPLLAT